MTLKGKSPGVNLKSGSNTIIYRRSCGKCSKTIKLRQSLNTVLCTATLEVVEASHDKVCEHYEERNKKLDQSSSGPR